MRNLKNKHPREDASLLQVINTKDLTVETRDGRNVLVRPAQVVDKASITSYIAKLERHLLSIDSQIAHLTSNKETLLTQLADLKLLEEQTDA